MSEESTELKKWYQACSLSHKAPVGVMSGHLLAGNSICRCTVIQWGQFVVAALLAGGVWLLNLWCGDGVRLLVALAATSAFIYIGLAILSRTGTLVFLNLIAVPIIFATAYAGLNVATEWLIISFTMHGSLTAVQLSSIGEDLSGCLFFWSAFNSAMVLFLLLG